MTQDLEIGSWMLCDILQQDRLLLTMLTDIP